MDPMRNGSSPPDNGLAKRLFSNSPQQRKGHDPSPSDSSTKRDPLRTAAGGKDSPVPGASIRKPRLGFCGGLIFLSLCLAAIVVTVHFNSWEWHRVTSKGLLGADFCSFPLGGSLCVCSGAIYGYWEM